MNPGESTTKSFPGTSAPAAAPATSRPAATPTVVAPASRALERLRRAVIAALVAVFLLVAVRVWLVDGLVRRVTIDGPSMAPTLLGAHYRVTCDDCGFPFACDATDVPPSGRVVCPNCGYRDNQLTAADLQPGERVLIDRWKLLWRRPARGDVVAAREPGNTDELLIKRVAGLPGERLKIQEGDLYSGGQIVRKTLRELRDLRVLVHDNAYQPHQSPNLPARWQPARTDSRWQAADTSFRIESTASAATSDASAELDWLEYHHWRCSESPAPRTNLVPIVDNDSFNQNLSRQLTSVTDVMVTCQIQADGDGRLALAAIDGDQRFEVIFDLQKRQLTLLQGGKSLLGIPIEADMLHRPAVVEFGLCDQQVLLAIGGRLLVRQPYERPAGVRPEVLHPLAIGTDSLTAEVSDLKVWRDIYYLEPLGTPRPWQAEQALGADQFALLGDNPPVSIDTRNWPGSGGIARTDVRGLVYRPFWSAAR